MHKRHSFLHPFFPLPRTAAILLAAGDGLRFGCATPKQFQRLCGKKIYLHTLEALLNSKQFTDIIIVCKESFRQEIERDLSAYPATNIQCISGGTTRRESSYQGILKAKELQAEIVLIHDAVRPFVSERILKENIYHAACIGAANTCIPSADTLVHTLDGTQIDHIPKRHLMLRGQTPQTFQLPLILKAHELCSAPVTDDCSLVLLLNAPVHIVQGSEDNIKITSPLDLILAEQILRHTVTPIPTAINSLEGKRIAVTGGTGGIGKAICSLLSQEGAIPIPLSRSCPTHPVDLSSSIATEQIFNTLGPLDGLINSIGYLKRGSLQELSPLDITQHITCNLSSVIYACKYAQINPGGHIINIASSSYLFGKKDYAIYSATKAALVNFSQGLALERPDLCINTLVPERTNTPLRHQNFPPEDPSTLLDPFTIAHSALSLLKTTLTGSVIPIHN